MKRLLVLALVIVLCGCSSLVRRTTDAVDPSDVAEVPDEVWQRVQKKIEDRAKAQAPKKETRLGAKQNQESSADTGIHRMPSSLDKGK